jgi:hypothetical protein
VIGNLPIAGALFRTTDDGTQREEVIILLTVHVVKDDDALAKSGAEAAQDVERYRVGQRQAQQWFGRERLAQAHYQWAMEHLSRGHESKALWDLNLALNNNPKLLPAMRLRERLMGRRQYEDDGSTMRGFVEREIMKEQGREEPLFARPGPPFVIPYLQGPAGFEGEAAKEEERGK